MILSKESEEFAKAKQELGDSLGILKKAWMSDVWAPFKEGLLKQSRVSTSQPETNIPPLTLVQEDYSKVLEFFMSNPGTMITAQFLEGQLDISTLRMHRTLKKLKNDLQISPTTTEAGTPCWIYIPEEPR